MRHLLLSAAAMALMATPVFAEDAKEPEKKMEAPAFSKEIAKAPAGDYVFEKNHASIVFKVMHMGLANYTMRFNDFDGSLKLDPLKPENSRLQVKIKAASLDANNPELTKHVSSADFLFVESFPVISFDATAIEVTGPNTGKITGDLSLHGVTKPVTLDVTFNNGGAHPFFKKYALGFSATAVVKRSDFDIKYGLPMVGDDVQIAIEAEMIQK